MKHRSSCNALLCLVILLLATNRALAGDELLTTFVERQSALKSWSADLIQTRTLKSFVQPLVSTGRVWFASPNLFRWELGTPAQTIALRQSAEMTVIYPRLKRAERYPLDGTATGPWKDTLSLLEAGFPSSRADLDAKFKVLSTTTSNQICIAILEPRSPGSRRFMPQLQLVFSTNDFSLLGTELQFADRSTLRNEFIHPKLNPETPASVFQADLGPDIKVTEPLKR
ncbi:MAG: outer membrane lipoprotein carrier protein LolA [Opitutaceae bacterium]|nr:outer membrane lipoprotein carrier protein LolA [Verrucomicrobiales bacterium]